MSIASAQSGHWTDEQLIDRLYGIGPADEHLNHCGACAARLAAMEVRRQQASMQEFVSDDFLMAQRRAVYARISQPARWWHAFATRRLAAASAMIAVLAAGSATVYQKHKHELDEARADVQLAQDVSRMSFESEPQATAPLKGLFVE
jgi:predicted anti-sigma-YlaC factor YlaD